MLQISSSNQTHVLVASNNTSLSCLEGRIYTITLLTPLPVLSTSSRCVEDTPGYTLVHTLVHDKYSPACWVFRKLRPKSNTIPCYTADCFKSSCLQFVTRYNILSECVWFCNVTPDFYRVTVTQQTLS